MLKGMKVKLEIDKTVQPLTQPARRIFHSMTSKVNDKLRKMRDEGIIEKVRRATQWLSPLIAIPKRTGDEEEEPLLIYTAQGSPFRWKKLSVINGSPEDNNVLKL